MPAGTGPQTRLHRREPQRKRTGVVLDEDRDESLEAAEDRAMDDDRTMLGIVGPRVLQIEIFGLHVVELYRRALPFAADRVRDIEIDLRSVKRAILLVDRVAHAGALERRLELRLGVLPRR